MLNKQFGLLLFIFLSFYFNALGQNKTIDSLERVIKKDPENISALCDYGDLVKYSDPSKFFDIVKRVKKSNINQLPGEIRSKAYNLLLVSFVLKNNIDSAIIIGKKGIALITESDIKKNDINLYINYGISLYQKNETSEGIKIFQFCISKLKSFTKSAFINASLKSCYSNLSSFYRNAGLYSESLVACEEMLQYINEEKDKINIYEKIASIYAAQKNYGKANEYFLKALNLIDSKNDEAHDREMMLLKLIEANSHERAYINIDSLWKIMHKNVEKIQPRFRYLYQNLLGNWWLSKKEFSKAFNCFDSAYKLAPNNMIIKSAIEYEKAVVLDSQHLYAEAEKYYLEAGEKFNKILFPTHSMEAFKGIADFFYKRGDYEKSIIFFNKYDSVSKSFMSIEKQNIVTGQQIKYETTLKDLLIEQQKQKIEIQLNKIKLAEQFTKIKTQELQIRDALLTEQEFALTNQRQKYQILEKEAKISEQSAELKNQQYKYETSLKETTIVQQRAEIRAKTQQRNWFLGVGSLALLSVLGLSLIYRRIKKQKMQIETQNREILHNNKNNLQQLISVFSMQAQNPLLKENSLENQERLHTLNLLNQMLYENSTTDQVSLKKYLEKLAESKKISTGNTIKITVSAPDIYIKSNIIKDIGLIANEQMTNSLKYAFSNTNDPHISVDAEPVSEGKYLLLKVKDNGKGLPDNFEIDSKRDSFGLEFMSDLIEQRHGQLKAYNEGGAVFESVLKIA
ncbi:MAG: histidine kinase dimerization/phosphoacceptor domain -containing protein [Lacibacter sp.]